MISFGIIVFFGFNCDWDIVIVIVGLLDQLI